jgi:NitT/TauT family transport system substrate-binding protein
MACCDETTARVPDTDVSRRSVFKGAALIASVIPAAKATGAQAQGKSIKLAYCSQLLCGVPYEVARSGGFFKNHGLEIELVYTRGGSAAMQALVGGAVDLPKARISAASSPQGACPCSRWRPRPRPPQQSHPSRRWRVRRSACRRWAMPTTL